MQETSGGSRSFSILVLLVCRNRRDTTLATIDRIKRQDASVAASIAVFDDASDDGTPEAIAAAYPEITIVRGDGNAFWNGGLHRLWSAVQGRDVDAFLWLNDDTWLDDDAFARLERCWRTQQAGRRDRRLILVGSTRDEDGSLSYGAFDVVPSPTAFKLALRTPDAERLTPVDTFNGNIVLVGKGTVEAIGLNDPGFFHNLGDVDYGLRARAAGIPVLLVPGTLGLCAGNRAKRDRGYGAPGLSVMEQWRKVNSHHGIPFASWWRLTRRHSGKWWPLHFLLPYRHLAKVWKLRDSGPRA